MTLIQFTKRFCANYQADGSCMGIGIRDDGSLQSIGKQPRCLIPDRCAYFEECVAPGAKTMPGETGVSARVAIRKYANRLKTPASGSRRSDPLPGKVALLVDKRECECGRPRRPNHKYCDICKKAKRRESWREQRIKG